MPQASSTHYSIDSLQPFIAPKDKDVMNVALLPNTTYPLGCAVGPSTAVAGAYGPYAAG